LTVKKNTEKLKSSVIV